MNKEKLMKEFLETKIYLDERDGTCNFSNDLRRKYPELIGVVDFANIYRRIVNYRIKKYGTSIIGYSQTNNIYDFEMEALRDLKEKKKEIKR